MVAIDESEYSKYALEWTLTNPVLGAPRTFDRFQMTPERLTPDSSGSVSFRQGFLQVRDRGAEGRQELQG